jgi:UDP-2,3-diacylglucosamine pyrophosphatase LpxH
MTIKKDYRTVWISDVHLGTAYSKADILAEFLKNYSSEKLYLVGDIVDGWMIKASGLFWPNDHNRVVRRLLEKSEKENTEVIYISGNHDEFIREFAKDYSLSLGNIKILNEYVHTTILGKTLWVIHGDHWDFMIKVHNFFYKFGIIGKAIPFAANKFYNVFLKRKSFKKIKDAVDLSDNFEKLAAKETINKGYDGIVCGHVHKPQISTRQGVVYLNCGDWVSSCSAMVENHDGSIELIKMYKLVDENGDVHYNLKTIEKYDMV